MPKFFSYLVCALTVVVPTAYAQSNILGLPAVPQTPVQATPTAPVAAAVASAAAGAASGATTKRKGSPATALPATPSMPGAGQPVGINDAEAKAVLSGGVVMASSYVGKVATVRVTTNNTYSGDDLRRQAVNAARLVQRDLALSCAWQCKPTTMQPPKVLSDGKLQFEMVIDNYPRVLSYDDMIAMLLGKPLAVMPKPTATLTVTATASAPAASRTAAASTTPPATSATAQ